MSISCYHNDLYDSYVKYQDTLYLGIYIYRYQISIVSLQIQGLHVQCWDSTPCEDSVKGQAWTKYFWKPAREQIFKSLLQVCRYIIVDLFHAFSFFDSEDDRTDRDSAGQPTVPANTVSHLKWNYSALSDFHSALSVTTHFIVERFFM